MPGKAGLSGIAVAEITAGIILVYSGIVGQPVTASLRGLIGGSYAQGAVGGLGTGTQSATLASEVSEPGVTGASAAYNGPNDLTSLWTANGGPTNTASFAAMVAMAESGGSATVTSPNPDGGTNVGLYQLDTKGVGAGYTVEQLQNPNLNTAITVKATNGGLNWAEWSDPVVNALGGNHQYQPS